MYSNALPDSSAVGYGGDGCRAWGGASGAGDGDAGDDEGGPVGSGVGGRELRRGRRLGAREALTTGRRAGGDTRPSLWSRRCHLRCRCPSLPGCRWSPERDQETGRDEGGGLRRTVEHLIHGSREDPLNTCELTAAAAEFSKASTASSQPRKPLTGPLSRSPRSGTPPKAPSKVAGPATSPPNCCCRAANQIRSSREAGVGHWGPPWTGLPSTFPCEPELMLEVKLLEMERGKEMEEDEEEREEEPDGGGWASLSVGEGGNEL